MPPRISPLKDAMHHVVTKSDKAKLEVKLGMGIVKVLTVLLLLSILLIDPVL